MTKYHLVPLIGILTAMFFGLVALFLFAMGGMYTYSGVSEMTTKEQEREEPLLGLWRLEVAIGVFFMALGVFNLASASIFMAYCWQKRKQEIFIQH